MYNINNTKTILKRTLKELESPFYNMIATSMAFYMFLSILPLLTLLSQILGLFSLSLESVREWTQINLSPEAMELFSSLIIPGGRNFSGNSFLIITVIYSASQAQYCLSRVTDYIYYDRLESGKKLFIQRMKSYFIIPGVLFVVVLILSALFYTPMLINLLFGVSQAEAFARTIWKLLRWPLIAALYFITISLLYYLSPSGRIRFRDVIPGSIFSSAGFLIVTTFYTLSTKYFGGNSLIYGSLSNIVVLLVWLWLMALVVCSGIVLNKKWKEFQ